MTWRSYIRFSFQKLSMMASFTTTNTSQNMASRRSWSFPPTAVKLGQVSMLQLKVMLLKPQTTLLQRVFMRLLRLEPTLTWTSISSARTGKIIPAKRLVSGTLLCGMTTSQTRIIPLQPIRRHQTQMLTQLKISGRHSGRRATRNTSL